MLRTTRSAWLLFLTPASLFAAGANVYVRHDLVSDQPGMADVTDPNLVNPWGVSFSATGAFWVSNTGKGNSTLYNGSGANHSDRCHRAGSRDGETGDTHRPGLQRRHRFPSR